LSIKDWLKFIVLGALWGSVFLWIKTAQQEIGPLTIVAFRVIIALVSFVIIFAFLKRKLPLRQNWKVFVVLSLLNIVIPFTLITWSQRYISSGMSSILNSTSTLFTLMLAHWLVPDDRLTSAKTIGLVLGFAGVVLLMSDQVQSGQTTTLAGQAAMLISALTYSLGTIFARRKAHNIAPEMIAMGQAVFGGLLMVPLAVSLEAPFQIPRLPLTWLSLIWLGLLCTCLSHMMYFSLLKSVGPTRTQMVTYVIVFFAVALGVIFLGEMPDWRFFAGGALVISGILIVNNSPQRSQNGREQVIL
jgi:drug/metabolite transporter (DMT)-like permease